jgi:hypothetical protein
VLRLLLKYEEMTEAIARMKARESGKATNTTTYLIGLENSTGWLLKTQSDPHPNVSHEQDRYTIAPKIRPYLLGWFDRHWSKGCLPPFGSSRVPGICVVVPFSGQQTAGPLVPGAVDFVPTKCRALMCPCILELVWTAAFLVRAMAS